VVSTKLVTPTASQASRIERRPKLQQKLKLQTNRLAHALFTLA
jgi:hypothetical protein